MNTISHYRPSKRPSVSQVKQWYLEFEDSIDENWRGAGHRTAKIESGYPFPDFYRATYTIDGARKSKLFYGETAWMDVQRFVQDLGFTRCWGSF